MSRLLLTLPLLLAGCATTSVTCTSLEKGECVVSSTRLLTDSAVSLATPDGTALSFSSKPNEAGTAALLQQLGSTINLLAKLVVPGAAAVPGALVTAPPS